MKRLFALIMTLLLVFGCEGLQPTPEAVITLDSEQKTEISLSSDGGAFDVSFTSALDWTAEVVYMSGGEGWASMNPTSGKGGYSIARLKINVQKNSGSDPRSAKVVITSGTKTAVITFKQEEHKGLLPGPDQDLVFRLTEKRAEVPAEGGTVKVTVEYNVDYKCEVTADWIREIESKSYDQKVHVFEVLPNDSEEPRNTTISFCGNGTCIPFMVEQAGCPPEPEDPVFELSTQSVSVEAEGGEAEVTVTSNVEYKYEVTVDWIKEVTSKAADEYVHTFEVMPNGSVEERSAVITFCGNNNCIPFMITQKGSMPEYRLEVDAKNLSVESTGTTSPIVVNVSSNVSWYVSSDSDWCVAEPSSGENDGFFYVSVSESDTSVPRIAIVKVSSSDACISREIYVIQDPGSPGADDSWKALEFSHKSLFMRFTADWCPYCPIMATALRDAQKELPDKMEALSVHGDGSNLASSASVALVDYYGIHGFPTGFLDCIRTIGNYGEPSFTTECIIETIKEIDYQRQTVTGASWTSSVTGNQAVLNLSLYIKKPGTYKVTALLVEDGIVGYQAPGYSDYVHNAVLRASFTDAAGDNLTVTGDGVKKDLYYSIAIPEGCHIDNMKVVVYVQKQEDGIYSVDNAASAELGSEKMLAVKSGNWGNGNEAIVPGDDINI